MHSLLKNKTKTKSKQYNETQNSIIELLNHKHLVDMTNSAIIILRNPGESR